MSESKHCYYAVLGLCKEASDIEIRHAYKKLALKWHPDRWMRVRDLVVGGQAKRRFQQIQEAYSVLSDRRKKRIYDAGMLGLLGDEDDDQGFFDFMQEMILMMENARPQGVYSLEELQGLLMDMMAEEEKAKFGFYRESSQSPGKRKRFSNF